jgi:hypothetical protein
MAALKNGGFDQRGEREEKTHEIIANLLVSPGKLFKGYDPETSGPMEQRFKVAVMYEVRSQRRKRAQLARQSGDWLSIGSGDDSVAAHEIPDTRSLTHGEENEPNLIQDFRQFIRERAGADVLQVFDQKMGGYSGRQIGGEFGRWQVERAMRTIQELAHDYARLHGNDRLLNFITHISREREARREQRKPADQELHNANRVYRQIERA